MGLNIENKYLDSSKLGTFDLNNDEDMKELKLVRNVVKKINADLREAKYDYQFYVKCQGRLGKNNPNAHKYQYGGKYGPFAGSVRLPDATRYDAYLYRRNS